MKIFFDHRIFFYQKYGGISRYYIYLFEYLKTRLNRKTKIKSFIYINSYLKQTHSSDRKGIYLNTFNWNSTAKILAVKLLNYVYEFFSLVFFAPDIYHITYYDRIPFHFRKTKIVVSVYDMIHELYPNEYDSKASIIKKECIAKADLVICISENTKTDLIRLFGIDEKKIKVIYLGFANFDEVSNQISTPEILTHPYILFVGQRFGYKNFTGLVDAYASSLQLQSDFNLVCCGGGAFTEKEITLLKDLHIENKVFQIAGEDDMLKLCYQKASVFVYPSLYEGFGIPPLEAMSVNTPVCCSNTSSIPEVVGNAAILFDPSDSSQIKNAMIKVLYSEDEKNKLVAAGKERLTLFTWEDCAQQTFDAYKSIL